MAPSLAGVQGQLNSPPRFPSNTPFEKEQDLTAAVTDSLRFVQPSFVLSILTFLLTRVKTTHNSCRSCFLFTPGKQNFVNVSVVGGERKGKERGVGGADNAFPVIVHS